MRQIKFRGLRTDGKGWVIGVPLYNSKITVIATRILDTGYKLCEYIEVIPESVGQFTGFHDKNGVEIYEGDKIVALIKHNGYHIDVLSNATVIYSDESCAFLVYFIFQGARTLVAFSSIKNIEIIGNIHAQDGGQEG